MATDAMMTTRAAGRPRRLAGRLSMLVIAGLVLAFPAGVAANSNNPITQTGGMSATLPLLGTPLTVDVTLDGVGNIQGVALDPADKLPTTTTTDGVVTFTNADGTAKVTVKASGDHLAIKAKAKLADLLGAGDWSAKVFGAGTQATVAYEIGKTSDGDPTIAIGAITTDGGTVATRLDPRSKAGKEWAWASAGVAFSRDGFTKRLTISVGVRKSDGSAKLTIVLSGRDRQKLSGTLAQLAGARTWDAKLCDGKPVSVAYHVTADGTVVFDSATGAPFKEHDLATGKAKDKNKDVAKAAKSRALVSGIVVRFTKTRVGLAVWLKSNGDGSYTLKIAGQSGHCGDGHGKKHHHRRHHHNGWGDGQRDGGHHGDGDRKPKSKP